jgi:hypothetical protein
MPDRQPIAFLSYVRSDDDHDDGRITAFRQRLEGEVKMQTGKPFAIFQDRNDIAWGQNWEERINSSLSDVTFLIPILTPSFFQSPACRSEFQSFFLKERMLGVNRLILPLYYVTCDQLGGDYVTGSDEIADTLRARNWTDWRLYRFKAFNEENVAAALAGMAEMIKLSVKEIESIGVAARAPEKAESDLKSPTITGLPEVVSEAEILPAVKLTQSSVAAQSIDNEPTYEIPEFKQSGPFDFDSTTTEVPYYAYTRQFDEVIQASDLADNSELLTLYNYVSNFSAALKKLHDSTLFWKLARYQRKGRGVPLAVSILIDNSGSMRGNKIIHTAAWCLVIIEWMDRLGIPTEILGFTTRAWKGGRSREAWLADGKPRDPGRLNDLRHLVYKSFAMTAEVSAPNFGMMAREGLLKENIDGEALLWASARLRKQKARNKMLFVFSDGAPVDDSTISVNAANFLHSHLRAVIAKLSKDISLHAIGIEHDVAAYYPNSVKLDDTSSLGLRFFDMLAQDPIFQEFWKIGKPKKKPRRE